MTRVLLSAGLLASAIAVGFPDRATAAFALNTNLIVNGNAESGAGSPTGFTIVAVPGWATTGNFTVVQYTAGGGFPTPSDPGPASRGSNFFAGGPSNGSSSAAQTVSLSDGAATIDAGGVTFTLSGFLGGFSGQGDNATLTVGFLNASNASLGSAVIGPVTVADRGGATGLLSRTATGALPVGTRSLSVTLQMTRTDGDYNDGYADNLSFVLAGGAAATATPLPASALLFGAGAVLLGVRGRRKAS